MSRVPMGKVLLRNVIRHTDAHNKIQEESEMWKLRGMEKGPSTSHRSMPPALTPSRSHMHCDRVEDGSVDRLGDRLRRREHDSSQDKREARYWTKKLYDFEANDPDRWGHSGFKELYPEFKSDWERDRGNDQNGHWRKKKSRLKTAKSKHLKKSSKKKKKKEEKRRTGESDGESSSDKSDSVKPKQKRKSSKSKHKREREEESSSEDDEKEEMIDGLHKRLRTRVTQEEEEKQERTNWRTVLRIEPFSIGSSNLYPHTAQPPFSC